MVIPQSPTSPTARLRDALAYPEPAARYSDAQLRQALEDALLPQLAARLDDEDAWSQKLSGGERQRLALARVFLKQTRMGAGRRSDRRARRSRRSRRCTARLLAGIERRRGGLVSIAHRPALGALHNKRWDIAPAPAGALAAYALRSG